MYFQTTSSYFSLFLFMMIPVIVGPEAKSEKWKKFVANLQPGLRGKYAKDPDYSGTFYIEKPADLISDYKTRRQIFYKMTQNCFRKF